MQITYKKGAKETENNMILSQKNTAFIPDIYTQWEITFIFPTLICWANKFQPLLFLVKCMYVYLSINLLFDMVYNSHNWLHGILYCCYV